MVAKLTLGPVLFHWPADGWRDFYARIADETAIDSVCIGEVVCAKRAPIYAPVMDQVVERLEAAGKEVVHSTLALVMDGADLEGVRALARSDRLVEANDVSAVALLAGRAHAIGPFVNLYNEATLAVLARQGAVRAALPVELPLASIAALAEASPMELEVQVFGRLPLALSVRCYHARTHALSKDACRFVCAEDADGLAVATLDGDNFLAVNGTQTLSHAYGCLAGHLEALRGAGIGRFRLSPHTTDMVAVAGIFRNLLDGRSEAAGAEARLAELVGDVPLADGFLAGAEGAAWHDARPG
jgi:collagenase-like PrtC family protease